MSTDLFARRFEATNGGARDLYDVKRHVETRGNHSPHSTVGWFLQRHGTAQRGGPVRQKREKAQC